MKVGNNRGVAMPLVLVVIFVISLLGTALWQYSITDTMHVSMDGKGMQAYYLAVIKGQ
jgi:Tfp pilus assembly protein PilV